jgi:predicted DNA-binding transcriptional regulator AlpA
MPPDKTGGVEMVQAAKGRRLLGYKDLPAKGITWSRQWLSVQIAKGKFPKPIALGESTRAFLESEVDAFIEQRIRERDAA